MRFYYYILFCPTSQQKNGVEFPVTVCYNGSTSASAAVRCGCQPFFGGAAPVGRDDQINIELTDKEFRRLLDLVYIGNWILNSTREKDRFEDYDILQEKLFALCARNGMSALISRWQGHIFPSQAYENGGIHEAIADYEDAVFFDILAEELARRDLGCLDGEPADLTELNARMDEYMDEFEKSGVENLVIEA